MRIYRAKVPVIAADVIKTLRQDGDVDITDAKAPEAEKDLVAILELYLKKDYELQEKAKDLVDLRGLTHSDLGRTRRELNERYNHPAGDEAISWLAGQFVEAFMASQHIEEVFADDMVMRRKVKEIFKRHMVDEAALDREVRERMKNLTEGTNAWTIQYQKIMREVRRKYGLS